LHGGILYNYNKGHVVLKNKAIIGDIHQLITLAKSDYQIEDAEISNSIVINRLVREETANLMLQRGRTIVYFELLDSSPIKSSELLDLGKLYIEL
jgi:uncharacterized phosphosugar-binding protein